MTQQYICDGENAVIDAVRYYKSRRNTATHEAPVLAKYRWYLASNRDDDFGSKNLSYDLCSPCHESLLEKELKNFIDSCPQQEYKYSVTIKQLNP